MRCTFLSAALWVWSGPTMRAAADAADATGATPQALGLARLSSQPALVPTPNAERARLSAALAEDLSESVRQLGATRDARVHLLLPAAAAGPLGEAHDAPKASVLVVLAAGARPVDDGQVRALVAGAIPGMGAEAVTVVQTHAKAEGPPVVPVPEVLAPGMLRGILFGLLAGQLLLTAAIVALLRRLRAREYRERS